ncbi:MAG: GNAT family N-acetyltransferase [Clostridia bacterium]|nr:GNAT family N-acetyltransferase [Clostridia bacterium]
MRLKDIRDLLSRVKSKKVNQEVIDENAHIKSPSTDLKGWKQAIVELPNENLRMFYIEKDFAPSEKPFKDAPDRITSFILAEENTIIGFSEVMLYNQNRSAVLCTQERLKNMMLNEEFPLDIKDNNYLTLSNDVAILVDDKHRGMHLGEKVLNVTMDYLKTLDIDKLEARDVREQALGFYQRCGGKVVNNKTVPLPSVIFELQRDIKKEDVEI